MHVLVTEGSGIRVTMEVNTVEMSTSKSSFRVPGIVARIKNPDLIQGCKISLFKIASLPTSSFTKGTIHKLSQPNVMIFLPLPPVTGGHSSETPLPFHPV